LIAFQTPDGATPASDPPGNPIQPQLMLPGNNEEPIYLGKVGAPDGAVSGRG